MNNFPWEVKAYGVDARVFIAQHTAFAYAVKLSRSAKRIEVRYRGHAMPFRRIEYGRLHIREDLNAMRRQFLKHQQRIDWDYKEERPKHKEQLRRGYRQLLKKQIEVDLERTLFESNIFKAIGKPLPKDETADPFADLIDKEEEFNNRGIPKVEEI